MGFRFKKRVNILPGISVNHRVPQGEALTWKNKRDSRRFWGGFQPVPVGALLYYDSPVSAAVFACLKGHFTAKKIFYDLRLDLRFVWYNGCELNDMDMY